MAATDITSFAKSEAEGKSSVSNIWKMGINAVIKVLSLRPEKARSACHWHHDHNRYIRGL